MKAAIVCLTRGLSSELLRRNALIYEHLNGKFNIKYPLIIFREGNIGIAEQDIILQASQNQEILFVDIKENFAGGYTGMCRFYMYDIWEYCKDYDYILRIDDDCYLTSIESDPFTYIGENVCLKVATWAENHEPTNNTLPQYIQDITSKNIDSFYTHQFPYTNVFLSSVKFWRASEVHTVLRNIAYNPMQQTHRWGDLPVLGSLLNIYAQDRVGVLPSVKYIHGSHDNYQIESYLIKTH